MKYLSDIDLNKNQLQNAVIHVLATAPSVAVEGQIYYNSTDKLLYRYSGTNWAPIGVVYSQGSTTGAVITGLNSSGDVTITNVVGLTLTGYTPVTGGYVTSGMTMQQAFAAMDTAIKNAVAGGGEVNQEAWSYIKTPAQTTATASAGGNATEVTIDSVAKKDTLTIKAGNKFVEILSNNSDRSLTFSHATTQSAGTYGSAATAGTLNAKVPVITVDNAGHISGASGADIVGTKYITTLTSDAQTQLNNKQATLVSGTNIKSINSKSLVGSGNLTLTQDDIGNGSTYVRTHNDFTDTYKEKISTNESDIESIQTELTAVEADVTEINTKIPSAASSSNQLADKSFVNSSIQNMAANYVTANSSGDPFASVASLRTGPYYHAGSTYTPTNNDYAVVSSDAEHENAQTRYIYVKPDSGAGQWDFQYVINNSPFTDAQWNAINSGITSGAVSTITNTAQTLSTHVAATNNPHSVTKSQVGLSNVDNVKQWAASNHPTTISGYGITDAKIEDGIVTLGSNTITPIEIINGHNGNEVVLSTDDIESGTTTSQYTNTEKDKLAGIATGATSNAITMNGASNNSPSFFAPTSGGTSGQVLVSQGSSAAPVWQAAPSAVKIYSANNPQLSTSGGVFTWTISQSAHQISSANMIINLYYINGSQREQVLADITVNSATYQITIFIANPTNEATIAAGTYRVVAIG